VRARPPRPSSPQVHGITKIASLVEPSSALSRSQTGAAPSCATSPFLFPFPA
jgi:hypothetical protein